MSTKITPDHLSRAAVVYVRQLTMAQVTGNLESQRDSMSGRSSEECGLRIGKGNRRRSRALLVRAACNASAPSGLLRWLLRRYRRRLLW